jgi:hypothetical protein
VGPVYLDVLGRGLLLETLGTLIIDYELHHDPDNDLQGLSQSVFFDLDLDSHSLSH